MEKIVVSFEQRAEAKDMGAVYRRGSFFENTENGWFTPDTDMSNMSSINNITKNLLLKFGEKEIAEEKKKENEWESILNSGDTLKIAAAIRDIGLPAKEIQRVEMLKILRNPGRHLNIDWDSLCLFSEQFNELYGEEKLKSLVEEHLKGILDFDIGVENSGMTREYKELMFYAFR